MVAKVKIYAVKSNNFMTYHLDVFVAVNIV